MITIPRAPSSIELKIDHLYNGHLCPDDRLWAQMRLSQLSSGLHVAVESPVLHEQSIPDAPTGSRVEGLWEHDVVELFLVGPGHSYVELELGAGGHFLFLSFDSVRHRSDDHKTFAPIIRHSKTERKTWTSEVTIPWNLIPENTRALNAFMIASGKFLALSPVPGEPADFHQPDSYPSVRFN